jgi:hypothetical protein
MAAKPFCQSVEIRFRPIRSIDGSRFEEPGESSIKGNDNDYVQH